MGIPISDAILFTTSIACSEVSGPLGTASTDSVTAEMVKSTFCDAVISYVLCDGKSLTFARSDGIAGGSNTVMFPEYFRDEVHSWSDGGGC